MATITGSTSSSLWTFKLEVSEDSYSIQNNTSDVTVRLYIGRASSRSYIGGGWTGSVTVDGSTHNVSGTIPYPTYIDGGGWYEIASTTYYGIGHNADGTKTIAVSSSTSSSVFTPSWCSASGNVTLTTIPRYTSITSFTVNKRNETSFTFNWQTSDTIDYVWYSTNNGSSWTGYDVTDGTSGSFTVSGLSPNTTYNCKLRVRRKDSQLTTDSSTVTQTTYKAPTQSFKSKTETTITMNWSCDTTANYIWYSKDNGSNWTAVGSVNATSGSYTISGLTANTAYNIKTRVRRSSTSTTYDTTVSAITTYPYPYLVSASNFTIGNNIPVNIKNPLNRSLTIYIIGNDNSVICTATRTTDGATNLGSNSSEIDAQYASIPSSNEGNYKVRIVCSAISRDTTTNGAKYYTNTTDCSPIFTNFTYKDGNTNIINVTGNDQVFVKGYSTVTVMIASADHMTVRKSASPKNYVASCDTLSTTANYVSGDLTISLGTILNSGTKRIMVYAYDSRNNSASIYRDITVYDYSVPVINATVERLNNFENQTTVSVSGSYSKLVINNDAKNTVTNVSYRYRETGGSWGDWTSFNTSVSDGYFTCTDVVLSLDNTKSFEFQFKATDRIDTSTTSSVLDIGKAIFFISSNLRECFVDGDLEVDGTVRIHKQSPFSSLDNFKSFCVYNAPDGITFWILNINGAVSAAILQKANSNYLSFIHFSYGVNMTQYKYNNGTWSTYT